MLPPGNQILSKALPTGQGKPDPTPDLFKKLVWGEQRRLRAERPEPPGRGASWGPGWAPRAPLSAPEQRHPPSLQILRGPGLAIHTGNASPASGARTRTRVLGLQWESPTGVLGTRRVVRNRILLFVLLKPSGSLTGHSEAPAQIWFTKSPHLERS